MLSSATVAPSCCPIPHPHRAPPPHTRTVPGVPPYVCECECVQEWWRDEWDEERGRREEAACKGIVTIHTRRCAVRQAANHRQLTPTLVPCLPGCRTAPPRAPSRGVVTQPNGWCQWRNPPSLFLLLPLLSTPLPRHHPTTTRPRLTTYHLVRPIAHVEPATTHVVPNNCAAPAPPRRRAPSPWRFTVRGRVCVETRGGERRGGALWTFKFPDASFKSSESAPARAAAADAHRAS